MSTSLGDAGNVAEYPELRPRLIKAENTPCCSMLNPGERLKLVAMVENSIFDSVVSFSKYQLLTFNTSDIRVKLPTEPCTLFLDSATSQTLLKVFEAQGGRHGDPLDPK